MKKADLWPGCQINYSPAFLNRQFSIQLMEYIHIGKIVATFGVKGEVVITHALEKKSTFKGIEVLFVEEVKGSYLPYFIQGGKAKNAGESYIKLEGVDSKEAAHRFIQKPVWLRQADFEKAAGKASSIGLIGFAVYNNREHIGLIEEVIEQPHQVLLRINYNSKEAYIPLHAETLVKINRRQKEVQVILPEGLLDIYR